jgi:hypothetical protein
MTAQADATVSVLEIRAAVASIVAALTIAEQNATDSLARDLLYFMLLDAHALARRLDRGIVTQVLR